MCDLRANLTLASCTVISLIKAWKKPMEGDLRVWKMTFDPWKTTTLEQNSALLKGRCFLII